MENKFSIDEKNEILSAILSSFNHACEINSHQEELVDANNLLEKLNALEL